MTNNRSLRQIRFLSFQQQRLRIFYQLFDPYQELDGLAPIDDAVVIGECDVHHRPHSNLALDHDRALLDGVEP